MRWRGEEERTKRLKLKLTLYGSYTRELEMIEHRYFEIQEELNANDMPRNSARNLRIPDDPYHPAVEKMKLEEASLIDEMSIIESEIAYLGLVDFFDDLTSEERRIIDEKYIRNNTYRNIADLIQSSKSNVHRRVNELLVKRDVSH